VLLVSPRFIYLVAGLCSLYLSVAPLLSRWHGPVSFFTLGFWIGAGLLLIAAIIPPGEGSNIGTRLALIGSMMTTALLFFGTASFVAFKLGYIHGKVQGFDYSKPVLITLLISSLAALLISALTMRSRRRSS
jgi:hypothetical protein